MKKMVKHIDGRLYILETFDSFNEILSVCNKREVKPSVRGNDITRKKTKSGFMGASSYEEAVRMLKYGYDEDVEKANSRIKNLSKARTVTKTSFRNDIVGFAPNVPNAIIGVPQSMINNVRIPKKNKVITIMVDMAVSSGTSKSAVFEYGMKVVQKIMQLEESGFRVRLEYLKCFNDCYDQHVAMSTVIKNENQPLDVKRILFPITHIAMQRFISWDWYDRLPDVQFDGGRGYSLSVYSGRNRVIENLIGDCKNKYIVVYGDDLEEVFKDVR